MKIRFINSCLAALMILTMVPVSCSNPSEADVVESVIKSRRSIRRYTDAPVSRETLDRIIGNGLAAPSGMNRQSYEIRVIDNPALLEEISRAANPNTSSIFVNATSVIFVANDTSYDLSPIDCGLLCQNIMLSAQSLGVGSCCLGIPVRLMKNSEACAKYMDMLGFSEGYDFLVCIGLGYPDEQPNPTPRKNDMVKYVE